MIRYKRFKKFYEIGSNRYYILPFDKELYLATENFLELPKKFFRKNEITQTIKMLELTPPILALFGDMLDMEVMEKDEEFEDMTKYKLVDNLKLRDSIKQLYKEALQSEIRLMCQDFETWCADFVNNNSDKYTEVEIAETIKANNERVNNLIKEFEKMHISNFINTIKPHKKSENDVVKKMLTNGLDFLYSHQLSSTAKVYYLYDLDKFGTITIYKVMCVKEVVKSIDSFIYNRTIAQELLAYIENNEL